MSLCWLGLQMVLEAYKNYVFPVKILQNDLLQDVYGS